MGKLLHNHTLGYQKVLRRSYVYLATTYGIPQAYERMKEANTDEYIVSDSIYIKSRDRRNSYVVQ